MDITLITGEIKRVEEAFNKMKQQEATLLEQINNAQSSLNEVKTAMFRLQGSYSALMDLQAKVTKKNNGKSTPETLEPAEVKQE